MIRAAVEEMGDRGTFKGYGPYAWLREKIAIHDFKREV